ncbi:hypothetical protein [Acidisphaera rubrifaciens]|uniref:Uncharacterized protein n=1 Tax=Acidisphaera rubrifaciens HS-AP3 TaxID=1231350 RepID=A0A0D6P907_9PROT|nr:hypothetical protein [Acidisphaera rubrifaciens]GAN77841.1 hypothetical protein Asru_0480_04 [Acidisphaera rubrifaciens HS-AP3]
MRATGVARRPDPRGRPWPRALPPRAAHLVQHLLLAGPFLGALAAVYRYQLSLYAPSRPDAACGQVIEYMKIWHGRYYGSFYVTRLQDALWHALGLASLAWMVGVVLVLVVLGRRQHRAGGRPS